MALPVDKAVSMTKTLLSLGATSAQANPSGITAFQSYVEENAESLLQVLLDVDKTGSKTAINHVAFDSRPTTTPLGTAIRNGNLAIVLKLLENGAATCVDFESWYVHHSPVLAAHFKHRYLILLIGSSRQGKQTTLSLARLRTIRKCSTTM